MACRAQEEYWYCEKDWKTQLVLFEFHLLLFSLQKLEEEESQLQERRESIMQKLGGASSSELQH